jgi:hypothetical protein
MGSKRRNRNRKKKGGLQRTAKKPEEDKMSNDVTTPSQEPTRLTSAQANDAWLKIIGRYDFYYGSVNSKAALLIAFNTFVAGSIALKWADIEQAFVGHREEFIVECVLLFALVATSLVSLFFTFRAINPFLGSPCIPNDYHSLIFFADVKKFPTPDEYHKQVQQINDADMLRDLAFQAHSLAVGLADKFAHLKTGVGWILYGQLPTLLLMVAVLLWTLGRAALAKVAQ